MTGTELADVQIPPAETQGGEAPYLSADGALKAAAL